MLRDSTYSFPFLGLNSSTMLFGSFHANATYLDVVNCAISITWLCIRLLCMAPSCKNIAFAVHEFDGCKC
jgi:hypothetical protein